MMSWKSVFWSLLLFIPLLAAAEADLSRSRNRLYPGGGDEEDIKVQNPLPDVIRKMDERTVQKEVFKTLFNQELKDEGTTDESPASDI